MTDPLHFPEPISTDPRQARRLSYRDVEWIDPEYYKSCGENDPSPLDLNLGVEGDEVR